MARHLAAYSQCRTLRSADDQRSVSGRTVKKSVGDHRWEPIRVYTLRERDWPDSPLRKVRQTTDIVEAMQWIGREDLDTQWTLQG
jgi:hypothetical protein